MHLPEYITINGTSYASAKLSEAARGQVLSARAADEEIARLQQQLAFVQTARMAYLNALMGELKAPDAPAKKKPRAPRKAAKSAAV